MDLEEIKRIVREEILYSCIVGSRMYGLYDIESDYDSIAVTKPSLRVALSPFRDIRIKEVRVGRLDIKIIPVQKFFYFLEKQNPNFVEYLYSDKIIKDFEYREKIRRKIEENLNKPKFYLHYLTIALRNFKEDMTGKTAILVIRSLLSAKYVLDFGKIPPINFWNLLKHTGFFDEKEIREILKKKREKIQKDVLKKIKDLISILPPRYGGEYKKIDLKDFFEEILVEMYDKRDEGR